MPTFERILLIGFAQLRRYGHTRVSWFNKLHRGLIQNGHDVLFFSDRDVAAFEAPFGWRDLGRGKANRRLLETAEAFEPTMIMTGHADLITDATLRRLKRRHGVPLIDLNNDPLFVPSNVERIRRRAACCDFLFVSTGKPTLDEFFPDFKDRLFHMPNPVDPAIERFDVSQQAGDELDRDLVFCGNATKHTRREQVLRALKEQLPPDVRFDTFGLFGTPAVWGRAYDRVLSRSAMGLNLNRDEGHAWYSSARMAQLAGNGLLVVTHQDNGFQTLLPEDSAVYYADVDDLREKIAYFAQADDERRERAARTRAFFHQEMNNRLYAQNIVETAAGQRFSHPYVWLEASEPGRV